MLQYLKLSKSPYSRHQPIFRWHRPRGREDTPAPKKDVVGETKEIGNTIEWILGEFLHGGRGRGVFDGMGCRRRRRSNRARWRRGRKGGCRGRCLSGSRHVVEGELESEKQGVRGWVGKWETRARKGGDKNKNTNF